jgi:crotonobetainyl-CoA:carnitine CoA-transferase CaiB-like acyl-CoA transferase
MTSGGSLLEGVRVFDLTSVIMGPLATQCLGDLGAEVITVETPRMSSNRMMTAGAHEHLSGITMNLLRNKRSIILYIKNEAGRDVALRLAASCDVVVTNLRPGPLSRLGLDYASVAARRPDVVYCQAQGYPSESDQADEPAYDDIIQASCGVADLADRIAHRPALVPTILADKVCGLAIVNAVLAALVRRGSTGEGAHLEVPMIDVMTAFTLVEHIGAAASVPPTGAPGYPRIMTPNRRPAATSDGWIHVLPYSRQNFVDLFEEGGRDDAADDPRIRSVRSRISHADSLYRDAETILGTRTTAEWLGFCRRKAIPASPVARLEDVLAAQPESVHPLVGPYRAPHPFTRVVGDHSDPIRRHAPLQGEHTLEILAELGLDDGEIAELIRSGAASTEPSVPGRASAPTAVAPDNNDDAKGLPV